MLFNTDLFITANKFKRFLGPEDGKGISRNEQLRNWLLEKLQKLKELLAKTLRSGENQSEPTSFEIEFQNESKSPKEIMTAILWQIRNPQTNIVDLGMAICDMEIYLARDCYQDKVIKNNLIAVFNRWLKHVKSKKQNLASLSESGDAFYFNVHIMNIAQRLKHPDNSYIYPLLVTHGYVKIRFYIENNRLNMQLLNCYFPEMEEKFKELNQALQQLQEL